MKWVLLLLLELKEWVHTESTCSLIDGFYLSIFVKCFMNRSSHHLVSKIFCKFHVVIIFYKPFFNILSQFFSFIINGQLHFVKNTSAVTVYMLTNANLYSKARLNMCCHAYTVMWHWAHLVATESLNLIMLEIVQTFQLIVGVKKSKAKSKYGNIVKTGVKVTPS